MGEALQETWRWVRFTTADGLAQPDVHQLVETDDGGLWVKTANSVAWFNEYSWVGVRCEALQEGMGLRLVQPLGRDSLLGLADEGMFVFRREGCRRVSVSYRGKELQIQTSSPGREGRVLLKDAYQNFYSWDGESKEASGIVYEGSALYSNRMSVAQSMPMFLAGKGGLMRVGAGGATVAVPASRLKSPEQLNGLFIRAVAQNRKGWGMLSLTFPQEWIGLWEWRGDEGPAPVKEMAGRVARMLAMNEEGDVLAVVNGADVWLREQGKWRQMPHVPVPLQSANSMRFDSQGRLWVCTDRGLWLLRANLTHWSRLRLPAPDLRNHVTSMLVARDGSLWSGTADGLLRTGVDGRVESQVSIAGQKLGLVTGLAEDAEGGIWCSSGATFTGVYRYFRGKWERFGEAQGLQTGLFHRVQVDRKGQVWVLATGRGTEEALTGAFLYRGGRFEKWGRKQGLLDERVYGITSSEDGTIWFGTVSAISRWDGKQWRHWSKQEGLKAVSIFALEVQPGGELHFVDRRYGLGVIGVDGKLRYEQVATAAAREGWDLLRDPEGHQWMSTRRGLLLRRDGEWSMLGASVGLESPELWPLALWRNHICVGTDGSGLYCLDRQILKRPKPQIRVAAPQYEGSTVRMSWRVSPYGESSGTEGNLARYRVDGGGWSAWTARDEARLTELRAGRHRIEFQAMDHFGARTATAAPIEIEIAAPLYSQPVFWIPVGLCLIAVAGVAIAFVRRTYEHNRQLAEKEESFRALIEYSSVGITLRDRNGRVFYVSPAVRIILGYEPDELLGEQREELIHPEDLAGVEARLAKLIENPGQTQRSRVRLKHKNGEYRWVEMISRNLFDNPSVRAIVTNLRDITDSTNAELAAAEARERAERANQAKSDFLAMISHEIRTPMNGITGMCQLLIESRLNREQQEYADTIAQSAQSLLALINDVLDFSRIEAGKLSIERAPLDLSVVLNEVSQLMRVRAEEKGIALEVAYPADAPRAFYGDSLRIRQILFNLTGNAVKFTHEGKISLVARIEYLNASRYAVQIAVKDTGIGIEQEKVQTVFKKFTQADVSTTRRYGGTGLGLSISRSLAELMGGSITVESTVGEGSTFTLMLQLDAAPETSLQRRESPTDALQPLPEPLDVLLVEDNKINQKLAMKLLQRLGCTVYLAENGLEALSALDKHRVDLILMDCQMPEMDGFEATRRIRQREQTHHHIPIIAVTANAMESDFERCLSSGMDSYLTKPIDFAKLREVLEIWGIDSRAPGAISDRGAV